jgi:predicted transcriptional regulator
MRLASPSDKEIGDANIRIIDYDITMTTNEAKSVANQNISVRTDDETLARIDSLAKSQDRSRNWWINQAIRRALAEEQAWIEKIEHGIQAAEAGDFASDKEVEAVFKRFETK